MVESDVHLLELADGKKETLINEGFTTIKSILECSAPDISSRIWGRSVYSTDSSRGVQTDFNRNDQGTTCSG
jgi:hypothetical protein